MAQPQGLNIPAIITTGLTTVLITAIIVEGVRAYYAYELPLEEARKWDTVRSSTVNTLREEQMRNIHDATALPIDQAMAQVAGGKMPAANPSTRPNT